MKILKFIDLNNRGHKLLTIFGLILSDFSLSVYTFYLLKDYEQFRVELEKYSQNPDFNLEIYKLFLQTLVFVFLVIISIHALIGLFFYKNKKIAIGYFQYYSLLAALSVFVSFIFNLNPLFLVVGFIYFLIYFNIKNAKTAG